MEVLNGRFGRSECGSHPKCVVKNPGKSGRMYLVDDKVFRYHDGHYEQGCGVEEQKSVKRSPLGNRCITMVLALVSAASFRDHNNLKINRNKMADT